MNKVDQIREAMRQRKPMSARYKGFDREFCPHVLGKNKGEWRTLAYQYGGESSHGAITAPATGDWRCFAVAELTDLTLLDGAWHSNASHRVRQRCITDVELEVNS